MLLVRCLMMDPNCLMPCGAVVDGGGLSNSSLVCHAWWWSIGFVVEYLVLAS